MAKLRSRFLGGASSPAMLETDVCLIVDGTWPLRDAEADFRLRQHIQCHPGLQFQVFSLARPGPSATSTAQNPRNLATVHYAAESLPQRQGWANLLQPGAGAALAKALAAFHLADAARPESVHEAWRTLLSAAARARGHIDVAKFTAGELSWNAMVKVHGEAAMSIPLADFYVDWRTLTTELLEALLCPLPPARVYHAMDLGIAGLVAARAAEETGRPVLLWDRGTNSALPRGALGLSPAMRLDLERKLASITLRAANRIATPWADRREGLVALGAGPERIAVAPRAVQTDAHRPKTPRDAQAAPSFALADTSEQQTDTALCLQIAAKIRRALPDADVLFYVGQGRDGALGPDHKAILADYGLAEALTIVPELGPGPDAGQPDLLILPQARESLPQAALLAGAAGIPVLTGALNPAAQLVEPELVLEDAAVADFADAATHLLMNPDALAAAGAALRGRTERRHALSRTTAIYDRLYRDLMAPGSGARGATKKEAA